MNYFELKNRESEFVAAMVADLESDSFQMTDPMIREHWRTVFRNEFLESIEANNWYEDQSYKNAIEILRQVAIEVFKNVEVYSDESVKRYNDIGLMNDSAIACKMLKKNEYKGCQSTDFAKITFNPETAVKWMNESDNAWSEAAEAAEEIGEQY